MNANTETFDETFTALGKALRSAAGTDREEGARAMAGKLVAMIEGDESKDIMRMFIESNLSPAFRAHLLAVTA